MISVRAGRNPRQFLLLGAVFAALFTATPEAHAIPYYARKHGLSCNACHAIVPKLNANGQAFWNRGYRLSEDMEDPDNDTVPFAAWITARQEEQVDKDFSEGLLTKDFIAVLMFCILDGEQEWLEVIWQRSALRQNSNVF